MTRKRKSQNGSLIIKALRSDWKFSAILATAALVASLLIIPSIFLNTMLQSLVSILSPLGFIISGVFYLIAVYRFFKQNDRTFKGRANFVRDTPILESVAVNKATYHTPHEVNPMKKKPTEWSLKLIQNLEWKRFEELCVAYYNEKGIRAETTKLGADGGIDIKLYQDNSGKPTAIAQCKALKNKIGIKYIREFLGVMTHEKVSKGFYLTSNGFTDDAKNIARDNNITLFNGAMILMMIKRLPEQSQNKLITMVTQGDYTTPTCVQCGTKMIRRQSKDVKKPEFWGCSNFPKCRRTLPLRAIDK